MSVSSSLRTFVRTLLYLICRINVAVGATDANSWHSMEPRFEVQPSAHIPCAPLNSHIRISSRASACSIWCNALRQLNHIFQVTCFCLTTINKYFAHLHAVCTRPAGSTAVMTDKSRSLSQFRQAMEQTKFPKTPETASDSVVTQAANSRNP